MSFERVLLLVLSLALMPVADSLAAPPGTECRVELVDPQPGQQVTGGMKVQVRAEVPPGGNIWVFARHETRRPRNLWWPQQEGWVNRNTGVWETDVVFGLPVDVGDQFDVVAAVVAQREHLDLRAYFDQGEETGKWPAIDMPKVICTSEVVTVTKAKP
jgi:hypothetical protein